jgi:hypothetical protein
VPGSPRKQRGRWGVSPSNHWLGFTTWFSLVRCTALAGTADCSIYRRAYQKRPSYSAGVFIDSDRVCAREPSEHLGRSWLIASIARSSRIGNTRSTTRHRTMAKNRFTFRRFFPQSMHCVLIRHSLRARMRLPGPILMKTRSPEDHTLAETSAVKPRSEFSIDHPIALIAAIAERKRQCGGHSKSSHAS